MFMTNMLVEIRVGKYRHALNVNIFMSLILSC